MRQLQLDERESRQQKYGQFFKVRASDYSVQLNHLVSPARIPFVCFLATPDSMDGLVYQPFYNNKNVSTTKQHKFDFASPKSIAVVERTSGSGEWCGESRDTGEGLPLKSHACRRTDSC